MNRRALLAAMGLCGAEFMVSAASSAPQSQDRWSLTRAAAWQRRQPWRAGCNYIPADAVNAIEMWQAATFDPERIARELEWAAGFGMNAVRVFLHDLVWELDRDAFLARIECFLSLADRHGIATLLVLFDSCWDPFPHRGPQPAPRPGVHNSRWVQSPGAIALSDRRQWARLQTYVTHVVSAFRDDRRVFAWDLWNEPDNLNAGSYGSQEPPEKLACVAALLPRVFDWARSARPHQPLTTGVWQGKWTPLGKVTAIQRIQLTCSDVLSFHDYGPPSVFAARIAALQTYGRPILCTEYMARPLGSTITAILPLARRAGVAAFNWGLVAGRTQTFLPWDSWQHATPAPAAWFHDLLYGDGRAYSEDERAVFRRVTGRFGQPARLS